MIGTIEQERGDWSIYVAEAEQPTAIVMGKWYTISGKAGDLEFIVPTTKQKLARLHCRPAGLTTAANLSIQFFDILHSPTEMKLLIMLACVAIYDNKFVHAGIAAATISGGVASRTAAF